MSQNNNLSDDNIIRSFLQEVKKRSDGSFKNMMSSLRKFFNYINKPIKDITMIDIKDYFIERLDKRKIKTISKNVNRFQLKSFFDYVQKTYLMNNIEYNNPFPSSSVFKFTEKKDDIRKYSQIKLKVFTFEKLNKLISYVEKRAKKKGKFKRARLRDFIIVMLEIVTGARISEIRTIYKEDMHIEEGFFETGLVKNARKSTLRNKKGLVFFFPNTLKPYLREYMKYIDDEEFFFPGVHKHSKSHITAAYTAYLYRELQMEMKFKFTWHWFRYSIITYRKKKMDCHPDILEMLMNHTPSTVEGKYYTQLSIPEKYEYYKKYFPYSELKFFGGNEFI